jgi:hypothetical protein
MNLYLALLDEVTCHYRRFNALWRDLTARMMAPPTARAAMRDPTRNFDNSVDEMFDYSLPDLDPSDMIGI